MCQARQFNLFGFGNCNLHSRPKYSIWSALSSLDVVIKMHNYTSAVHKKVYLPRFKKCPATLLTMQSAADRKLALCTVYI